jgi:hypothetical protein
VNNEYLGCRRYSHHIYGNGDFCKYDINGEHRPNNKTEATTEAVVGSSVVGGSAMIASSQIGLDCFFFLFFFVQLKNI